MLTEIQYNLKWIKDITPPKELNAPAYSNEDEGNIFKLHWPSDYKNHIYKPVPNDLILLKQKKIITHVVCIIDNEVHIDGEKEKYKFYRNVRCLKRTYIKVDDFLGKISRDCVFR